MPPMMYRANLSCATIDSWAMAADGTRGCHRCGASDMYGGYGASEDDVNATRAPSSE